MIGNDIVSLKVVQAEPRANNPRFLQKVLTIPEQSWLRLQPDKESALWILWALKESTYKAEFKHHRKRAFSPKSYRCYICPSSRTVKILVDNRAYSGSWSIKDGYLHALSWSADQLKSTIQFQTLRLKQKKKSSQSLELKQAMIDKMSDTLAIAPDKLQFEYEDEIPFLCEGRERLPIDISLSHHGEWGAFAFTEHHYTPALYREQFR